MTSMPLIHGVGAPPLVEELGILLAAAALFGYISQRLGVVPIVGYLVALSSTAVVLKLLAQRGATGSPTGEVSVAFLVFQDLAVVVMVLLVPMLGDGGGSLGDLVEAAVQTVVIVVFVFVVTRWLVPPILDAVARNTDEEEFLLAVLTLAAGIGYFVTLLGLTASLGAFVAGLVVSSGAHRERAAQYVMPFQVVFAAIFFASIGMLLDLGFVMDNLGVVLFLAAAAVVIKVIGTDAAVAVFKRPLPVIASSAFLLLQVGEFSFVLEKVGREAGLSPAGRGEDAARASTCDSLQTPNSAVSDLGDSDSLGEAVTGIEDALNDVVSSCDVLLSAVEAELGSCDVSPPSTLAGAETAS